MAFPSVASVVSGTTGAVNTNPVTIPIQAGGDGDLIVIIFAQDAAPTFTVDTAFSGINWKSLNRTAYSNIVTSQVWWKQAEGGDQFHHQHKQFFYYQVDHLAIYRQLIKRYL